MERSLHEIVSVFLPDTYGNIQQNADFKEKLRILLPKNTDCDTIDDMRSKEVLYDKSCPDTRKDERRRR